MKKAHIANFVFFFLFQSCSKPFTYGVCLEELGAQIVHQYVGQEPSGRMFNELSLDYNSKLISTPGADPIKNST